MPVSFIPVLSTVSSSAGRHLAFGRRCIDPRWRRCWGALGLRPELSEDRFQRLDARGKGIAGIVDGTAQLLGERLGFGVGEVKFISDM